MASATFLLPPSTRLGRQRLEDDLLAALGRADRTTHPDSHRRAQLLRHFDLSPPGWPMAALARQADAGDAGSDSWLRCDPAYVRPDINGARLLAYGDALALDDEDVAALSPALRQLFDEAGFFFDAPLPSHWNLRLARDATLPAFVDPEDALGEDIFDHLPQGEPGRHWRALLSEAQVVLHNHPWNTRRASAGKPPVNAVWFWGAGVLPDEVHTLHALLRSDDAIACALAQSACVVQPLPPRFAGAAHDEVFDLVTIRDPAMLVDAWLRPVLAAVRDGSLRGLELDFEDGEVMRIERRQRWRLWRKPLAAFPQ
jgi:hypothetical protein